MQLFFRSDCLLLKTRNISTVHRNVNLVRSKVIGPVFEPEIKGVIAIIANN